MNHPSEHLPLIFELLLPYVDSTELLSLRGLSRPLQLKVSKHIERGQYKDAPFQRLQHYLEQKEAPPLPISACALLESLLMEATEENASLITVKNVLETLYLRWPLPLDRIRLVITDSMEDISCDPEVALLAKMRVLAALPNPLLAEFHDRFEAFFFAYCDPITNKRSDIEEITGLLPLSLLLKLIKALPDKESSVHDLLLQTLISAFLHIFCLLPGAAKETIATEIMPILSYFFASDILGAKTHDRLLALLHHFKEHTPAVLRNNFAQAANIAGFLEKFTNTDATFASTEALSHFFIPLLAFYCQEDLSRASAIEILATFFHNQSNLVMQPDHLQLMRKAGTLLIQYQGCDDTLQNAIIRYSESNPMWQGTPDFLLHLGLYELIPPTQRSVVYSRLLILSETLLSRDPLFFFEHRYRISNFFSTVGKIKTISKPKSNYAKILLRFLYQEQLLCADSDTLDIPYERLWEKPAQRNLVVVALLLKKNMSHLWADNVLIHIGESLAAPKITAERGLTLLKAMLADSDRHELMLLQANLHELCLTLLSLKKNEIRQTAFWLVFKYLPDAKQHHLRELLWKKQKYIHTTSYILPQPAHFDKFVADLGQRWQTGSYYLRLITILGNHCVNRYQAEKLRELVLNCITHFAKPNPNNTLKNKDFCNIGTQLGRVIQDSCQHVFYADEPFWHSLLTVMGMLPAINNQGFFILFCLLECLADTLANVAVPSAQQKLTELEKTCYKAMLGHNPNDLILLRQSRYLLALIRRYNPENPDVVSSFFRHRKLRSLIVPLLKTDATLFTEKQKQGFMMTRKMGLCEKVSALLSLSFWQACDDLANPKNKAPTPASESGQEQHYGVF